LVRGDRGGGEDATTLWVRTGGGRDCAMQDINSRQLITFARIEQELKNANA
jgi:hypothetical protein